ncbi:hypothetical protein FHX42_005311 [Saccharopolyspora lacisalsi]|uniref:Uncharacterized protein n=1 Tax=Halosaccharopolyspora lacisalsi TaxID=1000566 RepID=A0A839E223_9PSEU|nr:hypothetical protein [Halosaccharopolyspora lacisalsi]
MCTGVACGAPRPIGDRKSALPLPAGTVGHFCVRWFIQPARSGPCLAAGSPDRSGVEPPFVIGVHATPRPDVRVKTGYIPRWYTSCSSGTVTAENSAREVKAGSAPSFWITASNAVAATPTACSCSGVRSVSSSGSGATPKCSATASAAAIRAALKASRRHERGADCRGSRNQGASVLLVSVGVWFALMFPRRATRAVAPTPMHALVGEYPSATATRARTCG